MATPKGSVSFADYVSRPAVDSMGIEEAMQLKEISKDFFECVQLPWTWPWSAVVPGGLLMSVAAAAAYKTVTPDFAIDTLSAHFLAGSKPTKPLQQKVQRLSDGGRFCTRVVTVEQGGLVMMHATCSFVRVKSMGGPSMKHTVRRKGDQLIEKITLDDLEPGRKREGPFMKFQRLPLDYIGHETKTEDRKPENHVYTSVAQISPPIKDPTNIQDAHRLHALGILSLSDYHILDCPTTVHHIPFGLPAIGDYSRTPLPMSFERSTSLNHRVQFHLHNGFRADDLTYIEAMSPWTGGRRAEILSRIYTADGRLVATCVQEAYYVLKDDTAGQVRTEGATTAKL